MRAAYEARQRYYSDFATRFVRNPEEALAPLLKQQEESIQAKIAEVLESRQRQQMEEQALAEFTTKNQWLYQIDPVTNAPKEVVGANGQRMQALSEAGVKFDQLYSSLLAKGLDQATALEAANGLYVQRYGTPQQETRKSAIATARLGHLKQAAVQPPARNGVQAAAANNRLNGKATRPAFDDFGSRFTELLGLPEGS